MSLDLANKTAQAHNNAAVADLSTVVATTFDSGDVDSAGKFLLKVDTTAGAVDAATLPASMLLADGSEAFTDGAEVTLVKVSTDSNQITFADPITAILYNYVNRQGESITLVNDHSAGTPRWVVKI